MVVLQRLTLGCVTCADRLIGLKTGVPKGAMLTHGNIVADSAGMVRVTYVAPGVVKTAYGDEEYNPGTLLVAVMLSSGHCINGCASLLVCWSPKTSRSRCWVESSAGLSMTDLPAILISVFNLCCLCFLGQSLDTG